MNKKYIVTFFGGFNIETMFCESLEEAEALIKEEKYSRDKRETAFISEVKDKFELKLVDQTEKSDLYRFVSVKK